ncbi:hypothetical protein [Robertmurraya andreesenii]|uniref:Phage protein n=1 Tax=Anoxybacillus andreesenii TaxID=1325932 RepID=A0ABT9V1W6_9BACL|nr:hypothetical protein [Robertmurraya andreesenii]MDQ0154947.1 hypothetical protein [Robertmurraya andreesenii]
MKQQIEELLEKLKEISNEKHNQGINLHDVSEGLSEWNFGYSEGLEHAIQTIESLIK